MAGGGGSPTESPAHAGIAVNKDNADSIAFYRRVGFGIAGSSVMDIGGGFVMDDYRMVKSVVD